MTWETFVREAPELARLAEERHEATGLFLLGTVRRDGSPRISPLEGMIFEGQLLLGMMWRSTKALDLLRDPCCLIHSVVSNKDGSEGEVKLRGRAIDVTDPDLRERFAQQCVANMGQRPPEPYHLFSVDIEEAAFIKFGSNGGQIVHKWRRGETPTLRTQH